MSPTQLAHGTVIRSGTAGQAPPRIAGPSGSRALRGDRRPRPEEADAGDLRPGQPRPAAAGLLARRFRPPRLGHPGLQQVVHDAVKPARPHPFPRGRLEHLVRRLPVRPRHLRRRRRRSTHSLSPWLPSGPGRGTGGNHAFYLSIPPACSPRSASSSSASGLATPRPGSWRRVVIEKPFGHDLKSRPRAQRHRRERLPATTGLPHRPLPRQGDRAEPARAALRQPDLRAVWNCNYVDHVQITVAEDIGVGGRAGYYDGIGAARDVIQNHLLQLLALTAMEEPVAFDAAGPARREGEGALRDPAARGPGGRHRPRPVRRRLAGRPAGARLPRREGHLHQLGHRDVRRRPISRSTPALGRDAVLPAHRQADRRRVTELAMVFKRAPHLPFTTTTPRNSGRTPSSSGSSRTRGSPSGSGPRCPAPRWRSATYRWTSPTATRSPSRSPGGLRAPDPRRAAR